MVVRVEVKPTASAPSMVDVAFSKSAPVALSTKPPHPTPPFHLSCIVPFFPLSLRCQMPSALPLLSESDSNCRAQTYCVE